MPKKRKYKFRSIDEFTKLVDAELFIGIPFEKRLEKQLEFLKKNPEIAQKIKEKYGVKLSGLKLNKDYLETIVSLLKKLKNKQIIKVDFKITQRNLLKKENRDEAIKQVAEKFPFCKTIEEAMPFEKALQAVIEFEENKETLQKALNSLVKSPKFMIEKEKRFLLSILKNKAKRDKERTNKIIQALNELNKRLIS